VCNKENPDKAHIKTRGSGGGDEQENIMPLCRLHHIEQHKIGIITFVEKYLQVRAYLQARDWTIVEVFGRKRLVKGE
jgi:predicted restriction endonuclease